MQLSSQKIEEISAQLKQDLQNIFKENLISIILYGSAVSNMFDTKKSDLNFLIVLKKAAPETLKDIQSYINRWKKKRIVSPLILTKDYILSSLDSFPIEFLNIKQKHRLVFGEDIFADIKIQQSDLRLQCERELKSKLLHLRQGYIQTQGKKRHLKFLIEQSIPAFIAIFKGLLYLIKKSIPDQKLDIFKVTCEHYQLDVSFFESLFDISAGTKGKPKVDINQLCLQYITEIERLSNHVDSMDN